MSHEITRTDSLMYTGAVPWHGMGRMLPEHCTPREALTAAGLDWTVETAPLYWKRPISTRDVDGDIYAAAGTVWDDVEDRVQLYRSDTADPLGIVSTEYVPFQNTEMVDFIGEVLGDDFAAVETAGSLRGGRRVWFLLDQGRHDVAGVDPVAKYSLFATGHDGGLAFRVLNTPIRVVCANTFRAAGAEGTAGISVPHRGNMAAAVESARHALAGTLAIHEHFIEAAERLAAHDITESWLGHFFQRAYTERIATPEARRLLLTDRSNLTPADQDRAERAASRMGSTVADWWRNFEDHDGGEASGRIYGSAWHALNSVTRWVNHQRPRVSDRIGSNLLGPNADAVQGLTMDALAAVE